MPRHIAFLRAINVGGHTVTMPALRALFESLGLAKVETFIASGNVIFESASRGSAALQKKIEAHLHAELGYEVAAFLRSDAELAAIARYQPFSAATIAAATVLNVAFLAEPASAAAQKALLRYRSEIDDFHVHGREAYWLCQTKAKRVELLQGRHGEGARYEDHRAQLQHHPAHRGRLPARRRLTHPAFARSSSCSRSSRRWTLPVVVIGSASMNSISFGYS
ncbi:MAG TPA: DUF1697 domain-containing protein [Albitalea sp.]|nr:DUF1697 domain-containing protein [Albitalea sp.]